MKKLDKYVLQEVSVPLVAGTAVFAMLFVANDMIAIYKNFNVESIPFAAILQLLAFRFPFWLSLTLPIGTSLGAALAVSRLARESEITAMRASGVSVFRVFLPLLLAGAMMAGFNFYVIDRLVPPSTKAYRKLVNEVGLLAAIPEFRSNVNLSIGRYAASFGTVRRGANGLVSLQDILLVERPRPGEFVVTRSVEGSYLAGNWVLQAPFVVRLKGDTVVTASSQEDLRINEPIRITDLFAPPAPEEETTASLASAISQNRAAKRSTTSLEVELHRRYSVPFACLIFAFTGAVVAFRLSRSGPFMGVLVSLIIVWLHFNLFVITGDIFGKNTWVSPVLAAWIPNVLFAAVGLLFLRRLE